MIHKHKRAITPTILQIDGTESGAICLAIILAYYELYISPEKAREACGVSRDGSKAINIIKAARNFGMDAEGKTVRNIQALEKIATPFIIFWEFEHFIVVEGIEDNLVYCNDPATGPRILTMEEFDRGFTGILIELSPSKKFIPQGEKERSVFSLLLDYLKDDKITYIYILITTLLLAFPIAVFALLTKIFIDDILIEYQQQWMPVLTISMILTTLSVILLTQIQRYYAMRYNLKFYINKIPPFFWKILHLPMQYFTQRSSGDLASRVHIYNKIAYILTQGLTQSLINLFTILIFHVLIFLINFTLGAITLTITLISFCSIFLAYRKTTDLSRRIAQEEANLQGIVYSGIHIIEELKLRGAENQYFSRWSYSQANLMESQQILTLFNSLIALIPNVLYFFNLIAILIVGSHLIIRDDLSAGGLIAIYTLLFAFSNNIRYLIENLLKINSLKGDLLRIKDIFKTPGTPTTTASEKTISTDNLLDVNNILFGYSRLEAPVLYNVNLHLKEGRCIGITGSTGSGKSSLINLIANLYRPWSGEIYFKGKLVSDYLPEDFFKEIAYVDQTVFLFEGSLRENLTLWDNSVTDEMIDEALRLACFYDISQLKGGLNFAILEGGRNLSLGQCQQIEIARALIKQPTLLLLDEATSALDAITESKIFDHLKKLPCSIIIVAHRLSAIQHCEELFILDSGTIIEQGTPQALMELGGLYHELIKKDSFYEG